MNNPRTSHAQTLALRIFEDNQLPRRERTLVFPTSQWTGLHLKELRIDYGTIAAHSIDAMMKDLFEVDRLPRMSAKHRKYEQKLSRTLGISLKDKKLTEMPYYMIDQELQKCGGERFSLFFQALVSVLETAALPDDACVDPAPPTRIKVAPLESSPVPSKRQRPPAGEFHAMLTKFDNLDLGPSPQKPSTRNVSRSSSGSRYTEDTLAMSSTSLYASREKSECATQHMLNLFLGSLSTGLRFNVEEQRCTLEWHPAELRLSLPLGSARIVSCNDGTLIARHQGHDGSWKQINPELPLCALEVHFQPTHADSC